MNINEISKTHLECGKIVNTHGVNGVVKAESWCDTPEILASLEKVFIVENDKLKKYKISKASVFKRFVLMELIGITSLEEAEKLRNKVIYLSRDDLELEEGEVFIADLIGLPVFDAQSNIKYGDMIDVINAGASDIYVIKTESGEAMIPAVKEFIKEIDLEKGVFVKPIEGMF